MSPASLRSLPNELLSLIFSHLCWHCVTPSWPKTTDHGRPGRREMQADLLSLGKVCRSLYTGTEPFRYHCVHLSREWDLYFLLRTLSDRPDLAARVSDLDIVTVNKTPLIGHDSSGTVVTNLAAALEALQNSSHDKAPPQDSAAAPTCHVVLFWLAMQLIPNLQRLHLPVLDTASVAPFIPQTSASPSGPPSAPSLKTLVFSGSGNERDYLLDQAVPIIQRAPNLEVLHCHHHARVTELFSAAIGRGSLADSPPMQNLTELALVDTFMTGSYFDNLVRAVGPKLSRVHIQRAERRPDEFDDSQVVQFHGAVAAVQPWCLTLKELTFTISGEARYHDSDSTYEFLPGFDALEILCAEAAFFNFRYGGIPPRDVLRWALPASICELKLVGNSRLLMALKGLVDDLKAGEFTHLRSVHIDDRRSIGHVPEQEVQDLGASFRAAGVAFTVRPTHHLVRGQFQEVDIGET